jgi:DNA-binding CsgD family transcriptional regulator
MDAVAQPDLRAALGLVRDLDRAAGTAAIRDVLLARMPDLVACDTLAFGTVDLITMRVLDVADTADAVNGANVPDFERHAGDHPSIRASVRDDDQRVARLSELVSMRAFRRTGLYRGFYRPLGIEHQVCVNLPHGGDRLTGLVFHRGPGLDFDERDVALLELLRPHLHAAVSRAGRRERLSTIGLTRRERQVLERVDAGEANAAIARRLGMRPRTVDKHLEHAYAKLGVASRTEALARLREITH